MAHGVRASPNCSFWCTRAWTGIAYSFFVFFPPIFVTGRNFEKDGRLDIFSQANYDSETWKTLYRTRRSGLIDAPVKNPIETKDLGQGFTIYMKRMVWKDAHSVCEEHEGHLASFINKQDAEHVINKIFEISVFSEEYDWGKVREVFGLDRRYWIGLTDLFDEGKWAWVGKGKPLAYNSLWYPNQPDHVNPDGSVKSGRHQHCVSLWNPAYWKVGADGKKAEKHSFDDVECHNQYYFICEKDAEKLEKIKTALASSGNSTSVSASPPPPNIPTKVSIASSPTPSPTKVSIASSPTPSPTIVSSTPPSSLNRSVVSSSVSPTTLEETPSASVTTLEVNNTVPTPVSSLHCNVTCNQLNNP